MEVDHPQSECSFTLINKSAWPIGYKFKVPQSILRLSTIVPGGGIVNEESSVLIHRKPESVTFIRPRTN